MTFGPMTKDVSEMPGEPPEALASLTVYDCVAKLSRPFCAVLSRIGGRHTAHGDDSCSA